jgi:hypothetical protein
MRLGAADYLIKLVMLDDLERLIREALLKGKVDIRRERAYLCSDEL